MGCASSPSPHDSDQAFTTALADNGTCLTRIEYGSRWIAGPGATRRYDDAVGNVSWDGVCHNDGGNSYAQLSNGWRPYFTGRNNCVLGLRPSQSCAPVACTTRVTYGERWLRGPNHPAQFDDIPGVVTWNGKCSQESGNSVATLSNGWRPGFAGADSCELSFSYSGCGELFANPVVDEDCPDPGVTRDGDRYVMSCTSDKAGNIFDLRVSPDLVHWTPAGHIFPRDARPQWASEHFWAPEIHRVGDGWIAYYSARNAADGTLALGAALAPTATGPFRDIGRPLVHLPGTGIIDVHHFEAPDGRHYLLAKVDGNATNAATPILIQELAQDGLTLLGQPIELINRDRDWEGPLVEGPWMIFHEGWYYLFYSGHEFSSDRYSVGVARAVSPLGPFEKHDGPILTGNGAWESTGHGSVVRAASGTWVHIYHAWVRGRRLQAPGRLVLVDPIRFDSDGWPSMHGAPSWTSQPVP